MRVPSNDSESPTTEAAPGPEARLPLSVIVDRMAGDGPRDEAFVRRFSNWFHEHSDRLRLDALETLGLDDVVLTFRMKGRVALVATGHHPSHPGEVTVRFREEDFPYVWVVVAPAPTPAVTPYEVCTLDYAPAGRPVALMAPLAAGGRTLPADARGQVVVAATIGPRREIRVRFDDVPDAPMNVPPDRLRWLDETRSRAAGPGEPGD